MTRARPLALLAAPLLVDCSLLALDEFDLPRCVDSRQCEGLNARAGISAGACARYQCARAERLCRLLPRDRDGDGDPAIECGGRDCDDGAASRRSGGAEACDGVDNDCNAAVDEGVWRATAPAPVGGALDQVEVVTSSASPDGPPIVAYASRAGRAAAGFADGAASLGALRYQRLYAAPGAGVRAADDTCPVFNASGQAAASSSCSFQDVSLAPEVVSMSRWFMAAVDGGSCAVGQLRMGYYDATRGAFVVAEPGSNVAFGVDVSPSSASCTGASRPSGVRGASRLALASLRRDASYGALLAWQARPARDVACGAPADVEVAGLLLRSQADAAGAPFRAAWALGREGGGAAALPLVLGATVGRGRPSVAAVQDAGLPGFVVGYGVTGGVALHFVPADYVGRSPEPASLTAARATPSFLVRGTPMSPVDQVAVAPSTALLGGRVQVGVIWREGCGASGTVWFARVALDQNATPGSTALGEPVQLAAGAVEAPAVAFVRAGFVLPGYRRAAAGESATEATSGGWLVTWVEPGGGGRRVVGRRVLSLDGQALALPAAAGAGASDDLVVVADGVGGAGLIYQALHPVNAAGRLTAVVYGAAGSAGALSASDLLCGR